MRIAALDAPTPCGQKPEGPHFMTLRVTDLHCTLKIGRRASRTACDAERRTIVGMLLICFSTMMALTTQSAT
ncbi:DUF1534 domain-containing protein [Pseudomonas cannabina]|nr:DUF1534 domain-containing protein [Pseudomonas cannabina]